MVERGLEIHLYKKCIIFNIKEKNEYVLKIFIYLSDRIVVIPFGILYQEG